MTASEAIEYMEAISQTYRGYPKGLKEACRIAISTIKEIQLYKDNKLCLVPEDVYSRQCSELDTYKEIGAAEECKAAMDLQKHLKEVDNNLYKIITKCSEYERIGTVEECREAVEKQKVKYIKIESYCPAYCPTCRFELSESLGDGYYEYFANLSRCPKCGQKICWDENLEGMRDE